MKMEWLRCGFLSFYLARKLVLVALISCITIPGISSSSDRLFNTWPKHMNEKENVTLALMRVNLTRRWGGREGEDERESSFSERFQSAVLRSKRRVQNIDAVVKQKQQQQQQATVKAGAGKSTAFVQLDPETPVRVGDGEFLMTIGVGSPSVSFEAIVDTGSDLIWTQCKPCEECFHQPTPIFDPSKSSTYSTVPCSDPLCDALGGTQTGCDPDCTFFYQYGDGSFTSGDLSYETLTIGSGNGTKVPHIGFGCGHDNDGQGFTQGGGLVGLGRGGLSLISQLGSKVDNKFSYCLLSISDSPSKTSPLFFGDAADLGGGNVKSMTLIKSSIIPTFWYIPITGITVDGSPLDIPPGTFDLKPDGSGGMIIDSGTTVTILDDAAYSPLKKAIQSAVDLTPADGSSVGLDLCYDKPSGEVTLPSLTFNFKGGVDYELPTDNYFVQFDDLLCLAMLSSSGLLGSAPSIFGNIQQQNFHILYSDAQNMLSFQHTDCDSL